MHRTAALAEVFSAQSLLLSQCTQEAAVTKLETIDLSETLKEVSEEIEKRHKGAKEEVRRERKTSESLETKCEDSRPTLDCSFDQRISWGDVRGLVGEAGEKQEDVSFVIKEEEEQTLPEQPYRLETDTSLVDALDESVLTVVQTEPALPTHSISPLVGKNALSRLARVKSKETSAVQQSFNRRSSTLWRL